ncbi:hypothetical protein [Microbacterium sp. SD291]|uniref:hypothetical protein n=1 Tax=Microbacterium sp. SD291 TaxID=2782007 RepID=UPI001A972EB9|nr:hypothetical protein [Microbacterium sp. SD291]MBO0980026.1 hypothetical protein [Microbacterium sp. SD291]
MPATNDGERRQSVIRVPGSRRARLTPAPGTDPEPETGVVDGQADTAASAAPADRGPNDDRLRQDVPPHY